MEIRIDCNSVGDEASLHTVLAEKLTFPTWYGKNLDALYDLLRDFDKPVLIVFSDSEKLKTFIGDRWEQFIKVFDDAHTKNKKFSYRLD